MASLSDRKKKDTDAAPPKSDAYTGVLIVSLLALIAGCVFLYLDYSQYEGKTVPRDVQLDLRSSDENPDNGDGNGGNGNRGNGQ